VGIALYSAAGLMFVAAHRRMESPAPQMITGSPSTRAAPHLTLWITACAMSALAVQGVLVPPQTLSGGLAVFAIWLLSVALFSYSAIRLSGWSLPVDARGWWRAHWRAVALAAAFGLAAFVIRVYDLQLHPYAFINDEGEVGQEARLLLAGQHATLFDVGWASQPLLAFVPAAISVRLLGATAFAVRLVSVLQGSLTVSLLFLLGREMFDPAIGALAAGVLLALPLHVHFSRLGVNNVGDAFFSTAAIWLTFRAIKRGTLGSYLAAGLVTGSALYTYLGSRLAIALVFGLLAYVIWRCRGFARRNSQALLIFAGAVLVVALPMAVFFIKTPDQFYARLNTEGILRNGFMQSQMAAGQSYLGILWRQFTASTLVYLAAPATAQFFNSPWPYLTLPAAIFFVLGLSYAIWRLGDPRYMTLVVWFWSVVILGSTLTVGPPSSQRLLMSTPPLALLVAIGLQKSAGLLQHSQLLTARVGLALCAVVVAISAGQGVSYYFGEYRWGHYFEDPSNDFSYEVAVKAEALGPSYRVFLLGEPSVFAIFGDFRFLAHDVRVSDFNTVTPDTLAALPHDSGAFFVAVPARVDDLRLVQQLIPGGDWQVAQRRYQASQTLYFAYVVPPQAFAKP
jgi:4-amino-4-deoxy-L-arabinose transferase-like glycosyltransferase